MAAVGEKQMAVDIERLERLKEDTAGLLAGLAKRIPTNPSPADHHDH
jgi:hypothetical protein